MVDHEKILVVDDEPRMCESLENLLSMRNYEVVSCCNGRDALTYLKKDPVDLVLLDLFMDDMNGLEVLEQLSAQQIDVMVIIITGNPSADSAVASFRKGSCDYLKKPFEAEELFKSVQNALERRKIEKGYQITGKKLHQAQKMEALSRMAGAMAHRFNNQLSVVTGNLELALDNLSPDHEIRQNLMWSMEAARQTAQICKVMLTYLGKSTSRMELIDLSEIFHQHLPALEMNIPDGIFFTANLMPSRLVVRANAGELKDVLSHLVTNACEAMEDGGGTISLATRIVVKSEIPKIHRIPTDWDPVADTFACIEVADSGCGMSEETMDKVFDPFFSTKFIGRGLGLSVASGVIRSCGGTICVVAGKEKGCKFLIFLPLVAAGAPRLNAKNSFSGDFSPKGAVLLVEDQIMVRQTAEEILKRIGFSVITAAGGAEAVEKVHAYASDICCVITDLTMPGMDGWNTLAALRRIRPKIPAILISGYDEAKAMGGDHEEQPQIFLHKPYSAYELSNALAQIVRRS